MSYDGAQFRVYSPPPPENVKVGAWVLCKGCSRGRHVDCERPCHCDLTGCHGETT